MSDSDENLLPDNIPNPRYHSAIKGNANFNHTNITSYTFRNNMMTSNFNKPNIERQRYGMRGVDHRSMYYRRETSPMSLRNFPVMPNLHNSLYNRGMSSQRSVINGRSGSPVSMRSIDSNASVSASDIALAFKNVNFNKYDLRLIKDAYNKFMKNRVRKRIEKRRNLKLFIKNNRQRSGDDSGDQGSDSSISSDDCGSSRATLYKENIQKSIHRPLKTELSHFRNTIKQSDMYKDCSENLKQNSLRNIFAVNSTFSHNQTPHDKLENTSIVTLKERFTKEASFLLPSQRFNKSITQQTINKTLARNTIPDNSSNKNNNLIVIESNRSYETESDKEEIFLGNTTENNILQNTTIQRKRILETEESNCSVSKRNKTTISPLKNNDCMSNNYIQKSDFYFKKPQLPVRKTSNVKKDVVPERLIAKSRLPLTESVDVDLQINNKLQQFNSEKRCMLELQNKELAQNNFDIEPDYSNQTEITQNSTTDVSMKPSFLKRKLFTQKLDVAESKNMSSDNLVSDSPQAKLYSVCREKNKVRKLVTSLSCLSRDVIGDDNVLDLIHKIVPPDQINITGATNKKELNESSHESIDKWDVASVISMCNNEEGSDTYTDEEIFKAPQNEIKTNNTVSKDMNKQTIVKYKNTEVEISPKSQDNLKLNAQCKVVVKKLQPEYTNWKNNTIKLNEPQCQSKRTVSNCVKSFWDTDFESDVEERTGTPWKFRNQKNQNNDIQKTTNNCSKLNLNKRNATRGTILTVRSFQNKGINSSMKSDISRVSKRKYPDDYQTNQEENNNVMQTRNSRSKQNINEDVKATSKTKKDTKLKSLLNQGNNELNPKSIKPKETKTNMQTVQDINKCNTSRESLRLKQKKEKADANLRTQSNDSTINTNPNTGRPIKILKDKNNVSLKKNNQSTHKNIKDTSNRDMKCNKNPTIKNATLNRTRQTPRKGNEKNLSSTTDQSSLNISNISTRSLRIRRKNVK